MSVSALVSALELVGLNPESLGVVAVAVLAPLSLATLVYLDARRRRATGNRRVASLTPLAWGATTFFSGVGCVVVAACYLAVTLR
ncbi:hypothetical protein [Halorussus lipolyticus]|uniref:hypothetical protein n=1 Tax=Halorussus lipolyticus TaxID=3034024 RepID=UPI0023E87F4D|nr:hypothetical protein [Halorussus sp. DT80]